MRKLVAHAFVEKGTVQLHLDGVALEGGYPIEVPLAEGPHILQWYAESPAGGQFTISISSPKSAEMQLTKRLGKGEKDWGGVEF
jgi:hypothetical protein